jgi:hypothetical protein
VQPVEYLFVGASIRLQPLCPRSARVQDIPRRKLLVVTPSTWIMVAVPVDDLVPHR